MGFFKEQDSYYEDCYLCKDNPIQPGKEETDMNFTSDPLYPDRPCPQCAGTGEVEVKVYHSKVAKMELVQ